MELSQFMIGPRFLSLPRAIWAIGFMTLLMNISTVIIFSLQPQYLIDVLGISFASLGLLEGTVEFFSWVTRVFSGAISDAIRRRKPLLIIAVGLTTGARGLFASASNLTTVFIARTFDRIANGLQASPRDAYIGDSAPKNARGKSYGLRQALGMTGSTIGAVLAYLLIRQDDFDYSKIFWIAAAFPALSIIIVWFYVHDSKLIRNSGSGQKPLINKRKNFKFYSMTLFSLGSSYWAVLCIAIIYMLSQYSGSFIILRANEVASSQQMGPLVMIAQNLAAMIIAIPMGYLTDRYSTRTMMAIGLVLVVISNALFFCATAYTTTLLAAFIWGIQLGTMHPLINAMIASVTRCENRGTGFGLYYLSAGAAVFSINIFIGFMRDRVGLDHAMIISSLVPMCALLFLPLLKKIQVVESETNNHKT